MVVRGFSSTSQLAALNIKRKDPNCMSELGEEMIRRHYIEKKLEARNVVTAVSVSVL